MKSKISLFSGLLLIVCLCLANANTAFAGSSPPNTVQTVDRTDFDCNLAIATPVYDVFLLTAIAQDDVGTFGALNLTSFGFDVPADTSYDLYAAPPNYERQGDSKSYGSLSYDYSTTTGANYARPLPAPRYSPELCGIDLDRSCLSDLLDFHQNRAVCEQIAGIVLRC